MSFGPRPWLQQQWDWRAAGNFVCGGLGSGLIVLVLLSGTADPARRWLIALGAALVGAGLFCVWLEIGRPLRAINVYFNPFTSWMTREAFASLPLFAAAAAAVFTGGIVPAAAAAIFAAIFAFCQARILCAARGIPAWREPRIVGFALANALAGGAGLHAVASALSGEATPRAAILLVVLLAVRLLAFTRYRGALAGKLAPRARVALDDAGRRLSIAGTLLPVLLALAGAVVPTTAAFALAGLLAAASGAWTTFVLVTRASYNQGFAIPRVPVRGVRSA